MPRPVTWVLVGDAGGAVVYQFDGAAAGLHCVEQLAAPPNPRSHEWGTDQPGRSFESVGGARHAIEPRVDEHSQAAENFARSLAHRLDAESARGRFDRLILVAPPRFLGWLRRHLAAVTLGKVTGSVAKDLRATSVEHLRDAVGHLLHPM